MEREGGTVLISNPIFFLVVDQLVKIHGQHIVGVLLGLVAGHDGVTESCVMRSHTWSEKTLVDGEIDEGLERGDDVEVRDQERGDVEGDEDEGKGKVKLDFLTDHRRRMMCDKCGLSLRN